MVQSRIAQLKARSDTLLDLRLDGELTKEDYAAKKAEMDLDVAKLTHRLGLMQVMVGSREDDLEQALWLANELPVLWQCGDEEERRRLLEAVLVRVIVKDKRVAASELRSPYSWMVSLAGEPGVPNVQEFERVEMGQIQSIS